MDPTHAATSRSARSATTRPSDAYAFTFRAADQRIDFDRVPNYPWCRHGNRGLERPFSVAPGQSYQTAIIVDETIATLYVDGVALNARMYCRPGTTISVDVVDGEAETLSATLAELSV